MVAASRQSKKGARLRHKLCRMFVFADAQGEYIAFDG